jgi:hypothetical protein
MIEIDKKLIKGRKRKLDSCRAYLKREFIGIDGIIDDLINYIQVWYLMPDVLKRPVIVNLWGMTGVGKTDLIRKMVKFLEYQDRFTEVELSNIDQSSYNTNVSAILNSNGLNDGKPAIVLFDEIQRFNTLDQDGNPMPQTKFIDFWELLSDGKLSKKQKDDLDYYLHNYLYNIKDREKKRLKGEEAVAEKDSVVNFWDARSLKNFIGTDLTIDNLSEITEKEMINLILKAKSQKKIYEPVDHSKTLIIISGNLDEAFNMAIQTSESDVDADIFHSYTKKITLVDIKNALSRKFRPEQVARFGNIHLIYTSLKKHDFEKLIQKEINRIIGETSNKLGIQLTIGSSINTLIYNNGVFPVQGVRPVFSSIIDILETNLSNFVFTALMNDITKINLDYDPNKKQILAQIGKTKSVIPYIGRIDKIRQSNEADAVANISVHECGHAIVYMLLMGIAPLQLKSKVASSYAGGFTFPHLIHETKETIINKIKIYLAGGLAEELIFGKQSASIGRSHDREQATLLAIEFIRKYGFDDEFQAVYTMEGAYLMDKKVTDLDVEKMIAHLVSDTRELLSTHAVLLRGLSKELAKKGSLEARDVADFAKKFGLSVDVKEEGYLYIANYQERLNKKDLN